MASRAETIRVPLPRKIAGKRTRSLGRLVREWYRKGQLGTSHTAFMGRYTGARF